MRAEAQSNRHAGDGDDGGDGSDGDDDDDRRVAQRRAVCDTRRAHQPVPATSDGARVSTVALDVERRVGRRNAALLSTVDDERARSSMASVPRLSST